MRRLAAHRGRRARRAGWLRPAPVRGADGRGTPVGGRVQPPAPDAVAGSARCERGGGRRWDGVLLDDPPVARAIDPLTWPGHGHAERTERAVNVLLSALNPEVLVWGGDWNH